MYFLTNNIAISFFVAVYGSFATIHYRYFNNAIQVISIHTIFSILFVSKEMRLCYLSILSFVATLFLYNIESDRSNYIKEQILRLEYPNIFYHAGPLICNYLSQTKYIHWIPTIKKSISACFIVSFIKFSIYDYSVNILLQEDNYNYSIHKNNISHIHLIITSWIFYGVNLYWFQHIILKSSHRQLIH